MPSHRRPAAPVAVPAGGGIARGAVYRYHLVRGEAASPRDGSAETRKPQPQARQR